MYEYAVLKLIGDESNTYVFPLFFMISGTEVIFSEKFQNETDLLNSLGGNGWELFRISENRIYYFKRLVSIDSPKS